jgi:uncharacterized protein involved in exopolysaccharide biosynthesis
MLMRATPAHRWTGSDYKLFDKDVSERVAEADKKGVWLSFRIGKVRLEGSFNVTVRLDHSEIEALHRASLSAGLRRRIKELEAEVENLRSELERLPPAQAEASLEPA